MPDILIRDVPSEVADALTERARAAGMDRQEWLRSHFEQLVQLPIVKVSYTLRFFDRRTRYMGISGGPLMGRSAFNFARSRFCHPNSVWLFGKRERLSVAMIPEIVRKRLRSSVEPLRKSMRFLTECWHR